MKIFPKIIYGIGIRCFTETILKRLNLKKFSSIFGAMDIKNSDNFIKCIKNMDILFDKSNLVFTKNIKSMEECNKKHGCRTLHRIFDDVNDYHTGTIAHHDLSNIDHENHFKRGVARLNKIKKHNLPTLFIQISHESEYNNSKQNNNLFDSFKEAGFNNYFLIQIYMYRNTSSNLLSQEGIIINENYMIYHVKIDCKYGDDGCDKYIDAILKKHFDFTDLISKDELDNLS